MKIKEQKMSVTDLASTGGKACLKKYGKDHYRLMAKNSWKNRRKKAKNAK